jgi:hypothetical protein
MKPDYQLKYLRLANMDDGEVIARLSQRLVRETGYSRMKVNPKKIRDTVDKFILNSPHKTLCLVTEEAGQVQGYLGATLFDQPFSDEKMALEFGWFVTPGVPHEKEMLLELREGFEEWARRHGVRYCQYAILKATPEDFERLSKQKRTTVLELIYQREV